jgi:hypothetical protein
MSLRSALVAYGLPSAKGQGSPSSPRLSAPSWSQGGWLLAKTLVVMVPMWTEQAS